MIRERERERERERANAPLLTYLLSRSFFSRCNSVGRCVIPCAFFGKSVKHTFSCRKMYPVYEKICLQFFFCVLTSQLRHKVTYPFLAYLSLESGVL